MRLSKYILDIEDIPKEISFDQARKLIESIEILEVKDERTRIPEGNNKEDSTETSSINRGD